MGGVRVHALREAGGRDAGGAAKERVDTDDGGVDRGEETGHRRIRGHRATRRAKGQGDGDEGVRGAENAGEDGSKRRLRRKRRGVPRVEGDVRQG